MTARYDQTVTPSEISPSILALCREIAGPGAEPLYLDEDCDRSLPPAECFAIVAARVAADGGHRVLGWAIWTLPEVFLEAEFHAVWERPDGVLVDIAPKARPSARTLFLRDNGATYQHRLVNNHRRALRSSEVIPAFFQAWDDRYAFSTTGSRDVPPGTPVQLTPQEEQRWNSIAQRITYLHAQTYCLAPPVGPYQPCPCGSGKKVKWCHGQAAIDGRMR